MLQKLIAGVPQGATDEPLYYYVTPFMLSNYADDNNLFTVGKDIDKIKETLAKNIELVTNWFYENSMVLNSKKCNFMCIARDGENETFTFRDASYKTGKEEVTSGITVGDKLNFHGHIRKMCKKSGQKLNALSKTSTSKTNRGHLNQGSIERVNSDATYRPGVVCTLPSVIPPVVVEGSSLHR